MSRRLGLTIAIVVALVAGWAATATWLVVFRDDFVARLIDRQNEMQFAYEDRLGALRARVDRITSHQLLEQDSVEGRMAQLLSRQAELETRHSIIATIAEQAHVPTATAAVHKPEGAMSASGGPEVAPPLLPKQSKPSLLPDVPEAERAADRIDPRSFPSGRRAQAEQSIEDELVSADQTTRALEKSQFHVVAALAEATKGDVLRLQSIVADVGLGPVKAATGGPFVPLKFDPKAGPFEEKVDSLQSALVALLRLRGIIDNLPLARPVLGDLDVTSGFGVRRDPFTRGLAMHTGIDLRADAGTPVRAAGPGRVIAAEYNGGYGNMVEVDHGNGVTTRYGHLSAIAVEEGQTVKAGAVLGRVGSSGRATGPHLHYETRLGDDPVDPQRFLRAGARLFVSD